jgi:hypothetical protein
LEVRSVVTCGLLIFIVVEIVSIPFGFILKIWEMKGTPFSAQAQSWLGVVENALECAVVIWFTFKVSRGELSHAVPAAFAAFAIAVLLAYPFDVLWANQAPREFFTRALFALIFCVPIGIFLGRSMSNA